MPRKVRTNKRRVGKEVTDTQLRWLNGEWLLGSTPRTPEETMEALSLMSNVLGQCEALWLAAGDPEKFFWRLGLDQPITRDELEQHKTDWLESGEGNNDPCGGDSFFVWKYFTDEEKAALWKDFGDTENFHWEVCLRRPIPRGASVDAAMVAFTTIGPFNIE
jgi:hypothetical protein